MNANFSTLSYRSLSLIMLAVGIVGGILSLWNSRLHQNVHRDSCQSQLRINFLGFKLYSKDNDDKFPLIALSSTTRRADGSFNGSFYGWADAIQLYSGDVTALQCHFEKNSIKIGRRGYHTYSDYQHPEIARYTDYWMNSNLSGSQSSPPSLILLGDGNGNEGNARYAKRNFPTNWRTMTNEQAEFGLQPPWFKRHLGGANYLFSDGRVKWLRPEEAQSAKLWKIAP